MHPRSKVEAAKQCTTPAELFEIRNECEKLQGEAAQLIQLCNGMLSEETVKDKKLIEEVRKVHGMEQPGDWGPVVAGLTASSAP